MCRQSVFAVFTVHYTFLVLLYPDVFALLCRQCDLIQTPSDCDTVETCNSTTAVCGVTRVITPQGFLYNLSCIEASVCSFLRDRSGNMVSSLSPNSAGSTKDSSQTVPQKSTSHTLGTTTVSKSKQSRSSFSTDYLSTNIPSTVQSSPVANVTSKTASTIAKSSLTTEKTPFTSTSTVSVKQSPTYMQHSISKTLNKTSASVLTTSASYTSSLASAPIPTNTTPKTVPQASTSSITNPSVKHPSYVTSTKQATEYSTPVRQSAPPVQPASFSKPQIFRTPASQKVTTTDQTNLTTSSSDKQTSNGTYHYGSKIVCPPTVNCKNTRNVLSSDVDTLLQEENITSEENISFVEDDSIVHEEDISLSQVTGCCNGNLCNEFKHDDLTSTSLPIQQSVNVSERGCRVCPGLHTHMLGCNNIETCQDTQVCYAGIHVYEQTKFGFVFGCEDTHKCTEFIKHMTPADLGKRELGIPICAACCLGYLCNQEDCYELKKNMTLESIGVTTSG